MLSLAAVCWTDWRGPRAEAGGLVRRPLQGCEVAQTQMLVRGDGDGSQISPRMGQALWAITWPSHGCSWSLENSSPRTSSGSPPSRYSCLCSNIAPSQRPPLTVLAKTQFLYRTYPKLCDFFSFFWLSYLSLPTTPPPHTHTGGDSTGPGTYLFHLATGIY